MGAVVSGDSKDKPLVFRGKKICANCLVPDVPEAAWRDWLLYFVYTPQSSFVQVMEHAFVMDCERRRGDAAWSDNEIGVGTWGISDSVRV